MFLEFFAHRYVHTFDKVIDQDSLMLTVSHNIMLPPIHFKTF